MKTCMPTFAISSRVTRKAFACVRIVGRFASSPFGAWIAAAQIDTYKQHPTSQSTITVRFERHFVISKA